MKEIYLMKKTNFWNSLPFKLMVGVLAGVVIGLVLSSTDGNAFFKGHIKYCGDAEIYS